MSYCVPDNYVEEDINEDIRDAIGKNADMLESIEVISETTCKDIPDIGKKRLGCKPDQKNVLVRITLRHLNSTLTNKEDDKVYDDVYRKVNYGEGGYYER